MKCAILRALIRLRAATIKKFVARICWLTCAKMRGRECQKAASSNQSNKSQTVPEREEDRVTAENASTDLEEPSSGERRGRTWNDQTLAIGDVDPVIDNARLNVRQHQRGGCVLLQETDIRHATSCGRKDEMSTLESSHHWRMHVTRSRSRGRLEPPPKGLPDVLQGALMASYETGVHGNLLVCASLWEVCH